MNEKNWKKELDPEVYYITREKGTERAFTGPYWDQKSPGQYTCACCGELLFASTSKYDSGSGWPSFYEPASPEAITEVTDSSLGMSRVEVQCAKCQAHLGHVFADGPQPTGLRYCINGLSLKFMPQA